MPNTIMKESQFTTTWYKDNLNIYDEGKNEVTKFIKYTKKLYGDLIVLRGKRHDGLGMYS